MRIFLLNEYPLYREVILQLLYRAYPGADVFCLKHHLEVVKIIEKIKDKPDYLIFDYDYFSAYSLDSLNGFQKSCGDPVFIILNYHQATLKSIKNYAHDKLHVIEVVDNAENLFYDLKKIIKPEFVGGVKTSNAEMIKLTRRQKQIAGLVKLGLSYKEISRITNLSVVTIKTHVHKIFKILGINSKLQLMHLINSGVISIL